VGIGNIRRSTNMFYQAKGKNGHPGSNSGSPMFLLQKRLFRALWCMYDSNQKACNPRRFHQAVIIMVVGWSRPKRPTLQGLPTTNHDDTAPAVSSHSSVAVCWPCAPAANVCDDLSGGTERCDCGVHLFSAVPGTPYLDISPTDSNLTTPPSVEPVRLLLFPHARHPS
jgi:hypothetical protein